MRQLTHHRQATKAQEQNDRDSHAKPPSATTNPVLAIRSALIALRWILGDRAVVHVISGFLLSASRWTASATRLRRVSSRLPQSRRVGKLMRRPRRRPRRQQCELSHKTSSFLLTTASSQCRNRSCIGWSRYTGTEAGMLKGPHFSATVLFSDVFCLRARPSRRVRLHRCAPAWMIQVRPDGAAFRRRQCSDEEGMSVYREVEG